MPPWSGGAPLAPSHDLEGDDVSVDDTILFLVGDHEPLRYGLTWRIWSRGTSFYIKTREAGLAESKVSLHGPDPLHPRPGFKFGRDASVQRELAAAVNLGNPLPWWFPGKQEVNNLTHAIRICVPADTLSDGAPNGGDPGQVRSRTFAGLLQAPSAGSSAMLDLYISAGAPEFPNRATLDARNAVHGPIQNRVGQYLSGVTRIVPNDRLQFPPIDVPVPTPSSGEDAVRGVRAAIAEDGVLWLVESVLSRAWLRASGT